MPEAKNFYRKLAAGPAGSDGVLKSRANVKTVIVQPVPKRPRHKLAVITPKLCGPTIQQGARANQRLVRMNVPPQTLESVSMDGSTGAVRARRHVETELRLAPIGARCVGMERYYSFKAERTKRVNETARVVSQLLTQALQQADKVMTLPQLSLMIAAISVEIVSGRCKPDLQGRIERILLNASDDEFYDDCLDECDPELDDK